MRRSTATVAWPGVYLLRVGDGAPLSARASSLAAGARAGNRLDVERVPMRWCRSQKPAKSAASIFPVAAGCHPARADINAQARRRLRLN